MGPWGPGAAQVLGERQGPHCLPLHGPAFLLFPTEASLGLQGSPHPHFAGVLEFCPRGSNVISGWLGLGTQVVLGVWLGGMARLAGGRSSVGEDMPSWSHWQLLTFYFSKLCAFTQMLQLTVPGGPALLSCCAAVLILLLTRACGNSVTLETRGDGCSCRGSPGPPRGGCLRPPSLRVGCQPRPARRVWFTSLNHTPVTSRLWKLGSLGLCGVTAPTWCPPCMAVWAPPLLPRPPLDPI